MGALAAVFLVKRIRWKVASYGLLAGLICMDLLSMLIQRAGALLACLVSALLPSRLLDRGRRVRASRRK
ncbi:MAG: hypothetical protein Q8N51_04890 [Gammaproteobacteria bacterium]|nr:hypothetical protein [Gammaproteobacteria bacterium]